MSKSKILMGAGALVLTAAGGIIVGRASTKFLPAQGLYYLKAGTCTPITTALNTSKLTTGGFAEVQANMRTSLGGSPAPLLWADVLCTRAVHFRY